jgi:hypothetical protein
MMNDKMEKFWGNLRNELHDALELTSQSEEELQKQLDAVVAEPLTEEKIESLVRSVTSKNITTAYRRINHSWLQEQDTTSIEKEVFSLNRNEGTQDEDVDEKLNKLRKKALEEPPNSDENEPQNRPDRMEDDEAAGEKSS